MEAIPNADNFWLCSVQALHPFYNRKTGEVVASWMTRFHREAAIGENSLYVDRVLERLRDEVSPRIPLALYGFSQGSAMAYRAALSANHPPDALIVLGGDLPPEISSRESLSLPTSLVGRGTQDRFYSEEALQKDLGNLERCGVNVRPVVFEGGHESNREFADQVGSFLAEVLES